MDSLAGRVALITGGSAGIGRSTAVYFAKYGVRLAISGRNKEKLQAAAEECKKAGLKDEDVFTVEGDITSEGDIQKIVQSTLSKFGTVHILVNNAGEIAAGPVETTPPEVLDKMYQQHVRAPYIFFQQLLPELRKNKGCVVNVTGGAGSHPLPGCCAYSVVKAAEDHMTRCLALEFGKDQIRVNAVSPAATKTELLTRQGIMSEENKDDAYVAICNGYPLGKVLYPEDMAHTIGFLVSDLASNITGEVLNVDGGGHLNTLVHK